MGQVRGAFVLAERARSEGARSTRAAGSYRAALKTEDESHVSVAVLHLATPTENRCKLAAWFGWGLRGDEGKFL